MLLSTPTKPYLHSNTPCDSSMSPIPKYNRRHCTPPRTTAAYDSPMLPPSPLRQHPLFPLDTNISAAHNDPALAHNFNPFFATNPQPIDDDEGSIFLSSATSGSSPFSPFFSTSTSQPLRTPVKQGHRVASRSVLASKSANSLFGFSATPASAVPPADLVSAQSARVGVGTKRKSTPHATPLRQNNLTPLKVTQSVCPDSSFERLAPLQAPKFTERTPQTKAETDAYLKRQTATLTRLRLSDHNPAANAQHDTEFDGLADDSGCEMDEDEPADSPFLSKNKPRKSAHHLVFQPAVTKGKEKEEVAEAVSPGGHITKRRARSRPVSAELREQAFKVPTSPIRQSGIPCRIGGANRPRHSGPVVFPSTAHRGRASPASNSPPSDAGSPRPRRRISGGSTLIRPGHNLSLYPPRPQLSRIESVSSATLFFGPAIPAPSPSKAFAPTAVRSRTSSGVHPSIPIPFSPLPVPRQQTQRRPNLANRHSYAGPDSGAVDQMWNAFQMRDVSPSPGSSPFQEIEDDRRSRRRDSTDMEDMFFAGDDNSFVMSVTSPKPEPPQPMPLKYQPRELQRESLRNSVSDEEDVHSTGSSVGGREFLNVMPNASTSVSSFCSDDYEGLVTPGFAPDEQSGWPGNASVFVNDDANPHGHPYSHDGGIDIDAFIMKTLADASKGSQTTAMPKKAPGTPVKKARPGIAYFGVERPWQSAVASKVGLKDDCEFMKEVKKPRKSMPAAFPVVIPKGQRKAARRNNDNNTDTEPEDEEEESPSTRRDTGRYTGLGLGLPPPPLSKGGMSALPRNRWLMRRSSSGAFSSGSESTSLTSTPTRSKGIDWQLPKPRIPLHLPPSGETLGKESPRSASGSSSSSSIITVHSPTAENVHGKRAAHDQHQHQRQHDHLASRPSVSTRTGRLSDAFALGFAGEDQLQPGRFARDFEEIEEVGSGEFGKVIKVKRKTGNDVKVEYAIKKSKRFEGVKHRLRLREEVDILKHLSHAALTQYVDGRHPNVLGYIDSWEEDEALFIQTELCESGNLARFLWEYGRLVPRLEEARVWKIVVDLSDGLRFIHDSGVIHLDLKPSNVFIQKGRFKIGDFGMASLWPRPVDTALNSTCISTVTSACDEQRAGGGFEREGDKLYLAPEVLQGRYSKAADVFSFGMTILETASNIIVPDQGEGWQRLRHEDFSQVNLDGVSPELVELIRSMMRTEPGRRMTVADVCAHPVVSRAREEMESMRERLRKEGKSEWGASPLAGVPAGFLEMILEESAMDTGA